MTPESDSEANTRPVAAVARPDAFFSYARKDLELVDGLCAGLVARGYTVWVDREAVDFSASWTEKVRAGIDAAKAVVCVLSSDWIESAACRFEYEYALARHKRFVPVAVSDDLVPARLPGPLAELNWVPATSDGAVEALAKTLDIDLAWRDAHARLLVRAIEWEQRGRDPSFALRGKNLRDAEAWFDRQTGHRETATPLQSQYILASRRGASRRQRVVTAFVGFALLVSLTLAALALWQRGVAVENERTAVENASRARSRELAALAALQPPGGRDRALLLSLEAYRSWPTVESRSELVASLQASSRLEATARAPGPQRPVLDIAVAPDGHTVASASGKSVRFWDTVDGDPVGRPLSQGAPTRALAFNPRHPNTLASAGADGTVMLWNLRRARPLGQPLRGPGTTLYDVAFRPDGRVLATAGADGRVRLWDVRRRRPLVSPLAAHRSDVSAVAFGSDGRILASAGADDGKVRLWDINTGREVRGRVLTDMASVEDVGFSPDDRTLAVAGSEGILVLWDWRRQRLLARLRLGESAVLGVAFDRRGERLAAASSDGLIRVLDLRARRWIGAPQLGHLDAVQAVAFGHDGRRLASAGSDGTVRLWRVGRAVPLAASIAPRRTGAKGVAVSADGTTVASAKADGTVMLTDTSDGRHSRSLESGHRRPIGKVALSRDAGVVASVDSGGTIEVRDAANGHRLGPPLRHIGRDVLVALGRHASVLASAGWDGALRLWQVGRRGPSQELARADLTPVTALAFSPSGRVLASADLSGRIRLWTVASKRPLGRQFGRDTGGWVGALAFSNDGTQLASGDREGMVELWDVATRRPLGPPFVAHQTDVVAIAFSPDRQTLATGDAHGNVRLMDLDSRRPLGRPMTAHRSAVSSLTFDANGALVSADAEGNALRWDRILISDDVYEWSERVCRLAGRSLSRAEWRQYLPGEPYHRACAR